VVLLGTDWSHTGRTHSRESGYIASGCEIGTDGRIPKRIDAGRPAIPFPASHVDGEVIGSRVSREPAPLTSVTDTAHARLPFVFLSKSCEKFGFPSDRVA